MKQKYKDQEVLSPGTVIISAAAHCNDITKVVEPVFKVKGGPVYYINMSQDNYAVGGSSFAQVLNTVGQTAPSVKDASYFKKAFKVLQDLIKNNKVVAGHDVASGGLITTLLEMCFADNNLGARIDLSSLSELDTIKVLFAENAGIVFQGKDSAIENVLSKAGIDFHKIGTVMGDPQLLLTNGKDKINIDVYKQRDLWYKTSYLLDSKQTANGLAKNRFQNYKHQPLLYHFPTHFTGKLPVTKGIRPKAAILREKGSNSEREMANAMFLAGFDVKDVHMTDLISGRETLEDISFIGAVGGFSNSDVLGSAKGWAGAFKYNEKARNALKSSSPGKIPYPLAFVMDVSFLWN